MAQIDDEIEEMLNGLDAYEDAVCLVCNKMAKKLDNMMDRIAIATITKPDYRERFRKVAQYSWNLGGRLKECADEFDRLGEVGWNKMKSEKDRVNE